MGVFTNSLKSFKSKITGREKSYKVNNAVWLFLEADYGIKQGDWLKALEENEVLTMAKFTTCILKANKIETTLEEVLENTDVSALTEFVNAYGTLALGLDDNLTDSDEKNVQ